MKSVRRARAICRGIGQRIDNLELLDDRAGPPVRDDERHRVFMFRTNVDEMNVQPIDLGHELRQGIQFCLALAPVVVGRPMAREFLNHRERHALRVIGDRFPFGPPRRFDASPQIDKLRFRHVHTKRTNSGLVAARRLGDVSNRLVGLCKSELTQGARSNRRRCRTNKTTARRRWGKDVV
jgi:hypothetical protein